MKTNTPTASAPLRAFHGKEAIKTKYLKRVSMHRAADEIVNGQYWENGKGCAVGCTIHDSRHGSYETELGIPRVLARLEDSFFEKIYRFDPVRAKEWPERFLDAPAVGADLSLVFPKLMLWILLDKQHGVIARVKSDKIFASVERVGKLYTQWAEGDKPSYLEWDKARQEAWLVWRAAAVGAAADAAAADAADADAADAGRWSTRWQNEYNAHYLRMSDKLIELMQAAPVLAVA